MWILDEIGGAITMGLFELENAVTGSSSSSGCSYSGNVFVSEKDDVFCPKEIRNELDRIYKSDAADNITRYSKLYECVIKGWRVSAHVCAYISNKEGLHGDQWKKEYKVASNVLCNELGIPEIYAGVGTEGRTLRNYGKGSSIIILNDMVVEAMRKYNCEGFIKSLKEKRKKEEKPVEKVKPVEVINQDDSTISLGDDTEKEVPMLSNEEKLEKMISSIVAKTVDTVLSEMMKKYMSAQAEQAGIVNDTEVNNETIVEEKPIEATVVAEPAEEEKASLKSPIKKLDPNMETINQNDSKRISPTQRKKFEDTFGKFLQGKKYQLNKILGGMLECVVHYEAENLMVTHIIDPGLVIGDEYYVIAPTIFGPFSTVMVHPSEVEILTKVFDSKTEKYRLTSEENQRALSHMFLNLRIYNVFDMSNMGDNIRRLKTDTNIFKKFGQKLTFIINCIDNSPMLGRLSFSSFKGIDNFELVSQNTKKHVVKSPLPGETLDVLSEVQIQVMNDDITIVFHGQSKRYHINEYGIM